MWIHPISNGKGYNWKTYIHFTWIPEVQAKRIETLFTLSKHLGQKAHQGICSIENTGYSLFIEYKRLRTQTEVCRGQIHIHFCIRFIPKKHSRTLFEDLTACAQFHMFLRGNCVDIILCCHVIVCWICASRVTYICVYTFVYWCLIWSHF